MADAVLVADLRGVVACEAPKIPLSDFEVVLVKLLIWVVEFEFQVTMMHRHDDVIDYQVAAREYDADFVATLPCIVQ